MKTMEWRTTDKSDWLRGPWDDEPDKKQWQDADTGLPCLIVRGPLGVLCGYVGVDADHPLHRVGYSDCEQSRSGAGCGEDWCEHRPENRLYVHGGVTFSGACSESGDASRGICHMPGNGEPDRVWWFGFDCGHAGDFTPKFRAFVDEIYRDIRYVESEVKNLAAQLAECAK
jgi:hypothetical protein